MAEFTTAQMIAIVEGLTAELRAGEEGWSLQASSRRKDIFSYSTANFTIRLSSQDEDSLPPYVVEIIDAEGILLDSVHTGRLGHSGLDERLRSSAETLYQLARRRSLNIDEKIKNLLTDLNIDSSVVTEIENSDDPWGSPPVGDPPF